jgi:integrase
MASVRKRTWTSGGKAKTAWIADYFDQSGKRHQQAFPTRGAADAFLVQALGEVAKGIHTPTTTSITVAEACQLWLEKCEQEKLARSTLRLYRAIVAHHIIPLIGDKKLARLTKSLVHTFSDECQKRTTREMARKALIYLHCALEFAQDRELVAQNVARQVRIKINARDRRKVGIGDNVPTAEEVNALMDRAEPHLRSLLVTAIFTGMRGGELRALTWENVDFERKVIRVRQAADAWGTIGRPKTAAGEREIPMTSMVVNTLREWKLVCPWQGIVPGVWESAEKILQIVRLIEANPGTPSFNARGRVWPGISTCAVAKQVGVDARTVNKVRLAMPISSNSRLWLVFPTLTGKVRGPGHLWQDFARLQCEIGMVGATGKAKYSLHKLRHFFASWAIEQGFPQKRLQTILGHASIGVTMDVYGHLFPRLEDDQALLEAGQQALRGGLRLQQK